MHTKEPWRVYEIDYKSHQFYIRGSQENGEPMTFGLGAVAHMPRSRLLPTEENARRIVACVNACAGFANPEKDIPAIETASKMHFDQAMANGQRASEYEAQRDELLAAMKKIRPFIDEGEVPQCFWSDPFKSAVADFDAAIAKFEA